VHLTLS